MISDCILVAVDGSENSLRALRAASEVSYEREGKLVVMNAFHVPPEYDSLASQMADGSHFISRLGKQAQPEVLNLIGILIFVDEDVFEALLILFQHIAVIAKDVEDMQ